MYTRPITYEEGEAMGACDICGFPYRYPSEMVYADDKLFYCLRTCWLGKTYLTDQRERAMAHPTRDIEQPPAPLKSPSWY